VRGNGRGAARELLHYGKTEADAVHYALEHSLPKVALYVPKRMLTVVVPDDVVTAIVKSVIAVNRTGKAGDGKIFVSPIEGALRVRTGDRNGEAIA